MKKPESNPQVPWHHKDTSFLYSIFKEQQGPRYISHSGAKHDFCPRSFLAVQAGRTPATTALAPATHRAGCSVATRQEKRQKQDSSRGSEKRGRSNLHIVIAYVAHLGVCRHPAPALHQSCLARLQPHAPMPPFHKWRFLKWPAVNNVGQG